MRLVSAKSSSALAAWYATHAAVRRLWAIKTHERLRIVIALEPSPNRDVTWPIWLANCDDWVVELQRGNCSNRYRCRGSSMTSKRRLNSSRIFAGETLARPWTILTTEFSPPVATKMTGVRLSRRL